MSGGRRTGTRRSTDRSDVFVDRYSQRLFLVACVILLLNMLDAYFTLLLLSHGGEELNPVATWLIERGTWTFIAAKTFGIGLCTATLVVIKNCRGAKTGIGLVALLYFVLLCWHFYLCGRLA